MLYALLIIFGFLGGMIAGMLGLGGGVIYILLFPHLLAWLGMPAEFIPSFVVANSLAGIMFASGVAILSDVRSIKSYFSETVIIAFAAAIISMLTTLIIVHSTWFSKVVFNSIVIAILLFILFQILRKDRVLNHSKLDDRPIGWKNGILSGSLTGFMSSISGLGGGAIIIPLLKIKFKQSQFKAKTISLSIMFVSSFIISVQNLLSSPDYTMPDKLQWGYILPAIMLPLVGGIVLGSPLGVLASKRMKPMIVNRIFVAFLVIVLIEKVLTLL